MGIVRLAGRNVVRLLTNGSIDISAYFALDAERAVWFRRGVRARKQEHGGVREIHPRIANHANPVLR